MRAGLLPLAFSLWALGFGWLQAQGSGQLDTSFFDGASHPAIQYGVRPADDPVARLEAALDAGQARLEFENGSGYLRSLLRALGIDADTQLAVFSRTSLQSYVIRPNNPRTIFFNDSVVVAWPRGGFIEIAAQGPSQGVAFYMLEQRQTFTTPQFRRERSCTVCHVSYATLNVPGMLLRSVAADPEGRALTYLANATPDHRTPFEERWGGWFVTGATAGVKHLGNATVANATAPDAAATPAAVPLTSLAGRFDTAGYLTPHSDVAAHLVFSHQMHMMNLITRIGWQTRAALADKTPTAVRDIDSAAVDFVDYLLFVDEMRLPAPVKGASGFAERFSALGPRDRRGRSLRELDLQTRVLKYPCSYLIYSPAFDALPAEAKTAIYARLSAILSGKITGERYQRLSATDRQAIVEILRETKPDFASYVAAGL
ncbi:MAG TPA: hypothetical protein VFO31_12420 [Vicinamibacterales bacterium]|nr:hypothetical protein [Vicinamibacterales bacterium]